MRSLLILVTLALVCFVDKYFAAAVRRNDTSSIDNAGSPIDAQAGASTPFDPDAALNITPADYFTNAADAAPATDAAAPATDAAAPATDAAAPATDAAAPATDAAAPATDEASATDAAAPATEAAAPQ